MASSRCKGEIFLYFYIRFVNVHILTVRQNVAAHLTKTCGEGLCYTQMIHSAAK